MALFPPRQSRTSALTTGTSKFAPHSNTEAPPQRHIISKRRGRDDVNWWVKTHCKNALPELEPAAYLLSGLLSVGGAIVLHSCNGLAVFGMLCTLCFL